MQASFSQSEEVFYRSHITIYDATLAPELCFKHLTSGKKSLLKYERTYIENIATFLYEYIIERYALKLKMHRNYFFEISYFVQFPRAYHENEACESRTK